MRVVFPEFAEIPSDQVASRVDELYPWPTEGAWVRANMVSTVDGRAQGTDGLSGQISPSADKQVFLRLRETADVILVGAGTLRVENYGPPAAGESTPAPRIAVVSGRLDLDPTDRLFTSSATTQHSPTAKPLLLTTTSAPAEAREALADVAEIIDCGDTQITPDAVIGALTDHGLMRIHCEGGPGLLHQLVEAEYLDELDISLSPLVIGGDALSILSGPVLTSSPRTLQLAHVLEAESLLMMRYLLPAAGPHSAA